jgi:hypothetical protein
LGAGVTKWKILDIEVDRNFFDEDIFIPTCVLIATVKKLKKAEMYQINVGPLDGGAYTYQDMLDRKWSILLGV